MQLEIDMETARKLHAALTALLDGTESSARGARPVETQEHSAQSSVADNQGPLVRGAEMASVSVEGSGPSLVVSETENTSSYSALYMRLTRNKKIIEEILSIPLESISGMTNSRAKKIVKKLEKSLKNFNADFNDFNENHAKRDSIFNENFNDFNEKAEKFFNVFNENFNDFNDFNANFEGGGGVCIKNSLNLTSNKESFVNNESLPTYANLEVAKEKNSLLHTHLPEKKIVKNVKNVKNEMKSDFEAFCTKYPVGRIGYESRAWKAWKLLARAGELPEIHEMLALIDFCSKSQKTNPWNEIEPRYIPYANRWLAEGAWKSALAEMNAWRDRQREIAQKRLEAKAKSDLERKEREEQAARFASEPLGASFSPEFLDRIRKRRNIKNSSKPAITAKENQP